MMPSVRTPRQALEDCTSAPFVTCVGGKCRGFVFVMVDEQTVVGRSVAVVQYNSHKQDVGLNVLAVASHH